MTILEIYAYMEGMLKVLSEVGSDLGAPGAGDDREALDKRRLDCAARLFFVERSLDGFLPKVAGLLDAETAQGKAAS